MSYPLLGFEIEVSMLDVHKKCTRVAVRHAQIMHGKFCSVAHISFAAAVLFLVDIYASFALFKLAS